MKHILFLITLAILMLSGATHAQLQLDTKHVKCFGDKDGRVTVTSVGGATMPIKKYSWSNGQSGANTTSIRDLGAGTYSVTVTDANGCTATSSTTVEAPSEPLRIHVTTSSGEFFVCGDGTIIVTVTVTGGTPPVSVNGGGGVYQTEIGRSSFGNGPRVLTFYAIDNNNCVEIKKQGFAFSAISCASDPNDITGPTGVDSARWHAKNSRMPYLVRFENDPEIATAPAQIVRIDVPVPTHINPFSVNIGDFGWGPYNFEVPEGRTFYQTRLDLTDSLNLFVDVTAGIDINENNFFWVMSAIDPATLLQPIDPQHGFLPVNDTLTGSGEGYVNFSVLPDAPSTTGDIVEAQAEIIFDANEIIETNIWTNVLDALPPTTNVQPFSDTTEETTYQLIFSGGDDPGGVGLESYSLYVSQDSGDFELYLEGILGDTLDFLAIPDVHYQFFSRGVDYVGNLEPLKSAPEADLFVLPTRTITIGSPLGEHACIDDSLLITWSKIITDTVVVEMSLDSGQTYFTLIPSGTDTSHQILVEDTMATGTALVRVTDLEDSTVVALSPLFGIHPRPVVAAAPDTAICEGDLLFLNAFGANDYLWSPDSTLNSAILIHPRATPINSTNYQVIGTDVYGCRDTGYVFVEVLDPCTWFGGPIAYVDSAATGLNNGTSWTDAFTDLQSALLLIYKYTDIEEIWVADGTYTPTDGSDRTMSFVLQDTVNIFGGFEGIEVNRSERDPDLYKARISGDIGVAIDSIDNSYHVVTIDTSCTDCRLDGVVIEWGLADSLAPSDQGAGVLSRGVATLKNVTVQNNTSTQGGAAILNAGIGAQLIIEDCVVRLNTSALHQDILNIQAALLTLRGINQFQDD